MKRQRAIVISWTGLIKDKQKTGHDLRQKIKTMAIRPKRHQKHEFTLLGSR